MLLKILGWLWLIAGILFLLKPEWLRENLKKKSLKTIRRIVFGFSFAFGLLLINATWGRSGWLATVVCFLGLAGIIKAVYFLKAKSADKAVEWFMARPVQTFRIFAVGQIILGAVILTI